MPDVDEFDLDSVLQALANADQGDALAFLRACGLSPTADLAGSDLSGLNLEGIDLEGADLRNCDLSSANLTGAHLKLCRLDQADLPSTLLVRADLSEATFLRTNLHGAQLSGAQLNYAKFSDADLSGAMLKGASVRGTEFLRCRLPSGARQDLIASGAIITEAEWTGPENEALKSPAINQGSLALASPEWSSARLAIDLGSANTTVFERGQGIIVTEPSLAAVAKEGRKVLAVGEDAREMLVRDNESVAAVRPLRGGVIADYEIAGALVKHILAAIIHHVAQPAATV